MTSIPHRERIVWINPSLADQIVQGIAEAKDGRTVDLGNFIQYAADQHDD